MKKSKREKAGEPPGQNLDYSKLSKGQRDACRQNLDSLVKTSGYPAMKAEYIRRLAEIEAASADE